MFAESSTFLVKCFYVGLRVLNNSVNNKKKKIVGK